jgi:ABC-type Zn uptake system ZnuABC Zn-binding protein ZnuA
MKRSHYLALIIVLLMVLSTPVAAQLRVVATTTDLQCLAESVGGSLITATSIGTGREDVHMLAAKPSFMVQANRADLWIRQGLELEIGFEPLVIEGARNPDIHPGRRGHLDASHGIPLLDVPTVPVDRSLGDVHPMGNPHYHLDPYNARIMTRTIRDRLVALDPDNREAYVENHATFVARLDRAMFGDALLDAIDAERLWTLQISNTLEGLLAEQGLRAGGWHALMATHRGKSIVTYHKSWAYFARRFGLVVVDELEPKPGIPPTPRHLAAAVACI